jgi:uncharacterized protein with HEPN domain
VSRHDASRLADVISAIDAITAHLRRGDLGDGLVYDAVRVRLIEIGETVKGIDPDLLATEPDIRGALSPACATTSRTDTSTSTPPS